MKRISVFAAVLALAVARPELYKEKEDFQFSRSSSDDGTKSGFYGAQRGNMGGNYERAHNMDSLAQNQMSGLVRQVEGELGDGAQTRTGSVFSAANSRGTYGSGHYDLSNLAGRNFQEGTSFGNSQSQSSSSQSLGSLSSSSHNSAAYLRSHSLSSGGARYAGYQRGRDAQTQTDDLQSLDNAQTSNSYNYGRQSSHSSGYQSNAGFQEQSEYDRSNANSQSGYGSNIRTRLISATPVRIVITPGGRVALPLAAQTYDATRASSAASQTYDATHGSSVFDQAALNSDTETSHDTQGSASRPESKHYESSFSYRKQWEKHDTIPATIPLAATTESYVPRNSELYEDSEARNQYDSRRVNSQSAHSSSASGRYNAVKSSSSQSGYQSNYNTQQSGVSSDANSNAYTQSRYNTHGGSSDSLNAYTAGSRYGSSSAANLQAHNQHNAGSQTDLNSQVEDLNTKPKSYQSSYSYHKSWERQGDPYVIKPASNVYYDGQAAQRLTSAINNQGYAAYQSGSHYGQNMADCDCDENGHIRVARSYNTEDMEQQSVDNFDGQEQGQQSFADFDQRDNGQQSQSKWENLEDFGQHSQSNDEHENNGQLTQTKWDNLQDFGQQSQTNDETQSTVQQSENKWDNLQDFGQQSQTNYDQQNVGQESQSQWESSHDLGQQSAQNWDQSEFLGQQSDNQRENKNGDIESLGQQSQNFLGEHNQDFDNQLANTDQHPQKDHRVEDSDLNPHSQSGKEHVERPYKVESPWDKFDSVDSNATKVTTEEHSVSSDHKTENNGFYWHQISNNGGMDQQTNNFERDPEYQNNHDINSALDQLIENLKHAQDNVAFDNSYNRHYSYSNGFANPSVYNHPTHQYQNTYQEVPGDYGTHSWNSYHSNSHWSSNWQQQEFDAHGQDSPLSSFWGKLDNIERESLSTNMEHPTRNVIYHKESSSTNFNDTNILSVTEKQPVLPQVQKDLMNSTQISKHPQTEREFTPVGQTVLQQTQTVATTMGPEKSKPVNGEVPKRPQDIGRGDISSEDIYGITDEVNEPLKKYEGTTQKNYRELRPETEFTVQSLDAQKTNEEKNNKLVSNNTDTDKKHKQNRNENTGTTDRQDYLMKDQQQQNDNVTKQSVDSLQQMSQQHDETEQQNHNFPWHHLPNFEQENVGQQNLSNFEQGSLQDFEQQGANQEQQILSHFEKQNVQHSEHQSQYGLNWEKYDREFEHNTYAQTQHSAKENNTVEQLDLPNEFDQQQQNANLDKLNAGFEQQNAAFDQQNAGFDQQNAGFDQQNAGFEQQNANFEQQNAAFEQQNANFDQQNAVIEQQNAAFDQQSANFDQQNANFDQQNSGFDQQNAGFEQQNAAFEQQNAGFEQQSANFDQQNANFDQQNAGFDQQNAGFEQHNAAFEQQNAGFEQQNANFDQQNAAFEQQNQFDKDDLTSNLKDHSTDQEPQNIQSFEQESDNVGQQNKPLQQVNMQSFVQSQNLQDFEPQSEHMQQLSFNDIGQQNKNKEHMAYADIPKETFHQHSDINEKPFVQTVHNENEQLNLPKSSDNAKIESPVEPTTEKPGFWKSVGSKFSNAKSKIASWFKST